MKGYYCLANFLPYLFILALIALASVEPRRSSRANKTEEVSEGTRNKRCEFHTFIQIIGTFQGCIQIL